MSITDVTKKIKEAWGDGIGYLPSLNAAVQSTYGSPPELCAEVEGNRTTILLSEQNLGFALALADRVYILKKGEVKYQGASAALPTDEDVQEAYLAF